MRRVAVVVAAVFALLALTLAPAAAEVPIPVDTDVDGGAWEDGVFLQVHTQRVFDEVTGEAIGKEVTHCRLLVTTTAEGIDETMTATDGEFGYQASVSSRGGGVSGRATFGTIEPGVTISTTNTDVAVSETCPGGEQPE